LDAHASNSLPFSKGEFEVRGRKNSPIIFCTLAYFFAIVNYVNKHGIGVYMGTKDFFTSSRTTRLAFGSLLAASSLALVSCSKSSPVDIIQCTGVPTITTTPLYIDKGICKKLAGGTPKPVSCTQWETTDGYFVCSNPANTIKAVDYKPDDYVKCYGIAAAGMNDCGTATTACGGSVSVARQKDAWVAIPDGVCSQIKGAVSKLEQK
jgi:uncharacterized membrane protein